MDHPEYIHYDNFNYYGDPTPNNYYPDRDVQDGFDDPEEGNKYKQPYFFFVFILFYFSFCYYKNRPPNRTNNLRIPLSNNNESPNTEVQETTSDEVINKIKKNKVKLNDLEEEKICSICLELFNNEDENIILDCKHIYHSDCIIQWITKNNSCPLCRWILY